MLEPAVTREERRRDGARVLMVDEKERERQEERERKRGWC